MADYKEYKPEQIFQKADFPRIKREDAEKKAPGKKPEQPAKPAVSPLPKPVPQKIADPGLPVWSPDLVFNKADFPTHSADVTNTGQVKPVPGPVPGFENRPGAGGLPGGASRVNSRDAGPSSAPKAASAAPGPSAVDRLFRQTVLGHPEKAVYLIRHWYWEKPGRGPASTVPGHDRIYIVLASLGPAAAGVLLDIMTPKEREQLSQILQKPVQFRPDQIALVRRQFVESITAT
ncbi:MAG: hypothetical protein HY042_03375 [Spirochaetia bacterium]|nr:hypothetical protein [Spirochaetia bacterium]